MFRKFFIFLMLGAIVGAIAYGYLYYGVVVIYTDNPKISMLHVVKKPERSTDFFFQNINKEDTQDKVKTFEYNSQDVPWHMLPEEIAAISVYEVEMDTR